MACRPAVPSVGLSLAAIRAFAAAHAGEELEPAAAEAAQAAADGSPTPVAQRFEALTTAQVVHRVIKPATAHTQGSYAELLLQQARRRRPGRVVRAR
jgi:hypothetical protein